MTRDYQKDLEICEEDTLEPIDALSLGTKLIQNSRFIKEALPYYINRCMELEAQVGQLRGALEHIIEYWNKDQNDKAMYDALEESIYTAEQALQTPAPARWEKMQRVVILIDNFCRLYYLEPEIEEAYGKRGLSDWRLILDALAELEGGGFND